jgi:hypothetical protein
MKIIAIGFVSLLAGVGIGWHFGYARSNAEFAKDVGSVLEAQEMDDAAAATIAVTAVQSIDSGQTQKAEQFLSLPIAHYCVEFSYDSSTNESLRKLRSRIDLLAKTNQVVAAQISNEMSIK